MKNTPTQKSQSQSFRRRFIRCLFLCLGILALAEVVAVVIAFLRPSGSGSTGNKSGKIIEAGPVDAFPPESVTAFVAGKFYLSRLEDGGFLALSCKCTHLGCTVPWDSKARRFICPCHASAYDIRGEVVSPPAPRALDLYPVVIENQVVKVNTGKRIKRTGFDISQVVQP